ncbi:HIT domain-containing protein [Candidatus Falkowbacteria bacterium]|jgi:histidine triad (HIT) family protein|nr:HIT domain-containing protein [Candidatus Falkowbacteria bacterium]MBT5503133.1 HIT domain-containing protein [Candidatus Falkowbacteria bacterium]MBT6574521.1 HIT domain-containing protein [Candidatus Falkowbacteria bacterium]MBT7348991.1 HIT domain-containing protein [Candidatus Falkowbacteria bacterium]MBT7500574.1 HIT domain-containing protein [Candidatus Falkowbacteria bacterium]
MDNCIFCEIITKKKPAKIIYENRDVLCFLPKKIEVHGHTLIVPKKHFQDLYDIPAKILCELTKATKFLTIEYQKSIKATGINLMHASGKDAQQSIFHFHFHLLPRFQNDSLDTWPKFKKIKVDNDELWQKLFPGVN